MMASPGWLSLSERISHAMMAGDARSDDRDGGRDDITRAVSALEASVASLTKRAEAAETRAERAENGRNRPKLAQIRPNRRSQTSKTGLTGQKQGGMQSETRQMSCGTGSRRYRCSSPRPRRIAVRDDRNCRADNAAQSGPSSGAGSAERGRAIGRRRSRAAGEGPPGWHGAIMGMFATRRSRNWGASRHDARVQRLPL